MNPTKRLTGVCSECGDPILFPAELVGTMTQCPRCGKQTELALPVPPDEPAVPRKVIVWTVITAVILVLGMVVIMVGLKHYENVMARHKDRAAAGFEVSAFSLEEGQGSNELYAVGTVINTSYGSRSHVTLELDLLDAGGQKVGVVRAYRPVLEPGAKWQVKVPAAADSKAVSARVASIKEGQ